MAKHYLEPGDRFTADNVTLLWIDGAAVLDPDMGLMHAANPTALVDDGQGGVLEVPLDGDEEGPFYLTDEEEPDTGSRDPWTTFV